MSTSFAARLLFLLLGAFSASAFAEDHPIHGLWLWKTMSVMERPEAVGDLRNFCQSQGITEVYVSVTVKGGPAEERVCVALIDALHASGIRVEALFGSDDADEVGHREQLLEHVRAILQFNHTHPADRFDGLHLDIEPQQRPENKGAGNLQFLPGLVQTFRAVSALAGPAGLIVNADIPNKLLKSDLADRRLLLTSIPRVTLMLYELSNPNDGKTPAEKTEKLHKFAENYLAMADDGLTDPKLAKMAIALRTPDYGAQLPAMLTTLDEAFHQNPHYLGWARHAYNDQL
jgi:hypothetical protein